MHFLIMDKYFNEEGFRIMKEYMVQHNIPHTSVKPVPFINIFVPEDVTDYSDATYEKYFDKSIPTMSFGSYALANQLIEAGYTPGGFINDNLNIKIQMEKWGNDVFLNSDAVFSTLSTLQKPEWKNIFIRPVYDTKKMIARVINNENFDFAVQLYSSYNEPELEVMVANAKDIIAEYRLFIVHGKVVAHSLYKLRGEVRMQPNVPEPIINIAESLCNQWVPADAFVMDFAETSDGFKVLEVNNINCAGFYAANIPAIVEAFRA